MGGGMGGGMGSYPGGIRGTGGGIGGGIGGRYGAGGGTPYFMLDGQFVENPTPAKTIEQLPDDLRQLLIDWAHEQDKSRNDGEIPVDCRAQRRLHDSTLIIVCLRLRESTLMKFLSALVT